MKTPRTPSEFSDFLDEEFAWRLKEIADIKSAIKGVELTSQKSIIRAGVPILYAHWEGFVKICSETLVNYIDRQGIILRRLRPCYIVFGVKKLISELQNSNNALNNIEVVNFFLNNLDSRADLSVSGELSTGSNLSSIVFERIATSIGVDAGRYETKYVLIDTSLVNRRNKIAHGDYLDLDSASFADLANEVIGLLRSFRIDIENIVTTESFKI